MPDVLFPDIPDTMPAQAADDIGRVPVFAFSPDGRTGTFVLTDGTPAETGGAAAIRQWFSLMLRQIPDAVPIYRTEGAAKIGVSRNVIGMRAPDGFAQAEIERCVRETAGFCPAVRSVGEFSFTKTHKGLICRFTAYLHDETTVEVTTDIDGE